MCRDRRLLAALLLVTPVGRSPAAETERPLLELGLAGAAGWFPDYPAAGQNHWQGIVLPFIAYRGEILRADETGVRGRFLRGDRVQLDVSLGGALPANSDDNNAREDMPDLDLMGEIGPNLRLILFCTKRVSAGSTSTCPCAPPSQRTSRTSSTRASSSPPSWPGSAWTCWYPAAACAWASARSSAATGLHGLFLRGRAPLRAPRPAGVRRRGRLSRHPPPGLLERARRRTASPSSAAAASKASGVPATTTAPCSRKT